MKADAPEFIPRSCQTTENTTENTNSSDQAETKVEVEERPSPGTVKRSQLSSLARRAAKKAGKRPDYSDGMSLQTWSIGISSFVQVETTSAAEDLESAPMSDNKSKNQTDEPAKPDKPRHKKPRFGRRQQIKSEPANRGQDSMDGNNDSEMTGDGSSEAVFHHPASNIASVLMTFVTKVWLIM